MDRTPDDGRVFDHRSLSGVGKASVAAHARRRADSVEIPLTADQSLRRLRSTQGCRPFSLRVPLFRFRASPLGLASGGLLKTIWALPTGTPSAPPAASISRSALTKLVWEVFFILLRLVWSSGTSCHRDGRELLLRTGQGAADSC